MQELPQLTQAARSPDQISVKRVQSDSHIGRQKSKGSVDRILRFGDYALGFLFICRTNVLLTFIPTVLVVHLVEDTG
jgi:hypothetical protein